MELFACVLNIVKQFTGAGFGGEDQGVMDFFTCHLMR